VDKSLGLVDASQVEMTIAIQIDDLEGAAPNPDGQVARPEQLSSAQIAEEGEGTHPGCDNREIRTSIPIEITRGQAAGLGSNQIVNGSLEGSVSATVVEREGATLAVNDCQVWMEIVVKQANDNRAGFWGDRVDHPTRIGTGAIA